MRNLYLCAISLMLCASCNQDESVPIPDKLTEKSPDWGYFNGTIGEHKVSLENTKDIQFVNSSRRGVVFEGVSQWFLRSAIQYTSNSYLVIDLHNLKVGTHYVNSGYGIDTYSSFIELQDVNQRRFWPKADKPIKVEITKLHWLELDHPILKANIEGIVYNTKNSNDSIVIKGSYGAR
ncbi:MAG: DUF5025 domain-containing protein [Bacteroides sp.]